MRRDDAALVDIAGAARLIIAFSEGMSRAAFGGDLKTQKAVLHEIIVLGEAVKRLSPSFRAAHPNIPWSLMAGMRDHLTHEYDDVDLDEIWKVVTRDAPALLGQLAPLLHHLDDTGTR